jgi:hypothetical protein
VNADDVLRGSKKEELTDEQLIAMAKRTAIENPSDIVDLEEELEELFVLQTRKAYFNEGQPGGKRYKVLRDRVTDALARGGPRLFQHKSTKFVGVRAQAFPVEIRDEVLADILKGKDDELLDLVMPRTFSRDGFKKACSRGANNYAETKRFTPAEVARIAYFGAKAAYVRYVKVDRD